MFKEITCYELTITSNHTGFTVTKTVAADTALKAMHLVLYDLRQADPAAQDSYEKGLTIVVVRTFQVLLPTDLLSKP